MSTPQSGDPRPVAPPVSGLPGIVDGMSDQGVAGRVGPTRAADAMGGAASSALSEPAVEHVNHAVAPGSHERRRAILIGLSVLIVVGAILRIALSVTHFGPALNAVGVKALPPSQLTLGACLASEPVGSTVRTVGVITCAQPHASEVFAVRHLASGQYPGDAAVLADAESACNGPEFTTFAQQPAEDTSLKIQYLVPTIATWALGETTISCLVSPPNGLTTGTLRKTEQ